MSGRKMVINTQERALSNDVNRLQLFANADRDEILRHLLASTLGDETGLGQESYVNAAESPMRGEVLGGLLVKPQSGSLDIQIDPGVLACVSPDSVADESNLKLVRSAGVGGGVLAIGSNVSGSIRIDVIECRVNPTPDLVTDNRDIFDETTGLFTAQSVTKESTARLEFRIRQGTAGSGIPAHQSGWLPLCIASVPSGVVSNDDVAFWDVRPLAADRAQFARQGANSASVTRPHLEDLDGQLERISSSSALLTGYFRGTVRGRVIGGIIRSGAPGATGDTLDLLVAANQATAITEPLSGNVYVYACFPFGLPRWAAYNPAPGTRTPRGPMGILVASYVEPDVFGRPSAVVAVPAAYGLGGNTQISEALCFALTRPNPSGSTVLSFFAAGKRIVLQSEPSSITGTYPGSDDVAFSVTSQHWPPNAKHVTGRFQCEVVIDAESISDVENRVQVYPTATASGFVARQVQSTHHLSNWSTINAQTQEIRVIARDLPLPVEYPGASTTYPRAIVWDLSFNNYESGGSVVNTFGTATLAFAEFQL